MKRFWFSVKEIAGLKGVPGTSQNVKAKAKREDWTSRPRKARGGGKEYHISNLPNETQDDLLNKKKPKPAEPKILKKIDITYVDVAKAVTKAIYAFADKNQMDEIDNDIVGEGMWLAMQMMIGPRDATQIINDCSLKVSQ